MAYVYVFVLKRKFQKANNLNKGQFSEMKDCLGSTNEIAH